jgi:hypothetical protein
VFDMPTNRNHLECTVCGTKTITRVSLVYGPYREFAFPCRGCAVEIRLGVEVIVPSEQDIEDWCKRTKLPKETYAPTADYTKLLNAQWITPENEAEWIAQDDSIENVEILDDDFLVSVPKQRNFSPFLLAFNLMGIRVKEFQGADRLRREAAVEFWPRLQQLKLHFNRKQWNLFDKQFEKLFHLKSPNAISDKARAMYEGEKKYGLLFCQNDDGHELVKARLDLAEVSSRSACRTLVDYYQTSNKDIAIENQLHDIRRKWALVFSALAALYTTHYWDGSKHQLTKFTLAQKRFDEIKALYVDSFETFCRVSVIAAGLEGIISIGKAVIPKAKGEFTLEEFDIFKNGSKPDVLKRLGSPVAELFVPFMNHRLRNGIGHNSAKYDIVSDLVEYQIANEKGITAYAIPYILFCESMFHLYIQLEAVSLYVTWIRLFYKTEGGGKHLFSTI